MRIAYICADPGVPVFGRKGCSVHVQEVARALVGSGARVHLFASRIDGDPPVGMETVSIHQFFRAPSGDIVRREQAALAANQDLSAALDRHGPFDLVYERYSLWSYAGIAYARATGVPGLLEVNAPLIEEQSSHRGLTDHAGAEWVRENVFASATALLAVSSEVATYLRRFPTTGDRVHVVPNGVDSDRFSGHVTPSYPGQPGSFTIGFVGTLKPWHGLADLIEAFSILHPRDPSTRLLIVGDGPERATLDADLARRGIRDAVQFTGAVDPREVPGLLASMDVAVAPYPPMADFYFSPMKIYEYLAAARPIVASRIGQLDGLIRHDVNGLLCPPGNPSALAAAIERLRRSPELRARLGQSARATVLEKHTWAAVAARILALARRTTRTTPDQALVVG